MIGCWKTSRVLPLPCRRSRGVLFAPSCALARRCEKDLPFADHRWHANGLADLICLENWRWWLALHDRFGKPSKNGKEQKKESGTPNAVQQPLHLAMRRGPLWRGTSCSSASPLRFSPKGVIVPKAQLQARLPGTWSERALPAFACPSPASTATGHNAGETDAQAARERTCKPAAGTALARRQSARLSGPPPSQRRGGECNYWVTNVKG